MIGNYVNWNGETAQISQILEREVVFSCGESDLIEKIRPLPLSEHLLFKFGFDMVVLQEHEQYKIYRKYFERWVYAILFFQGKNADFKGDEFSGFFLETNLGKMQLPYIHLLQNHYSLTGQKLKL